MSQTLVETAFSARLLSHSGGAEFQNGLETQAFRPFGWCFHRLCCPIQTQGLDIGPTITDEEVKTVIGAINSFVSVG